MRLFIRNTFVLQFDCDFFKFFFLPILSANTQDFNVAFNISFSDRNERVGKQRSWTFTARIRFVYFFFDRFRLREIDFNSFGLAIFGFCSCRQWNNT